MGTDVNNAVTSYAHQGGIPPFAKYNSHLLYELIDNFLFKQILEQGSKLCLTKLKYVLCTW